MNNTPTAWVFTYYDEADLFYVLKLMQKDDCIIAVDGGLDLLFKHNIVPHLVIGDFDSVSQEAKDKLHNHPSIIQVAPEKDETDTELALNWCFDKKFTNIRIVNSMQERFDHCLGIIAHLEYGFDSNLQIQVVSSKQLMYFANKHENLDYPINTTFSLCPVSESVQGVETLNCYYPLKKETLYRNKSRGISNLISQHPAKISFTEGKLLIIIQLQDKEAVMKDNLSALSRYNKKEGCYA